jgi:hypothetical protein
VAERRGALAFTMGSMVRVAVLALCLCVAGGVSAGAQTRPQTLPPPPPGVPPQPVGRPAPPSDAPAPAPQDAAPGQPVSGADPAPAAQSVPPAAPQTVAGEAPPTEQLLGLPIYPGARFLRSYDAGQGQRYYLFGATATYAELVAYYRTTLRTRGDEVYDAPPVHMFEVGRFREQTMAFPPGVTIKDYTWGGAKGYLVPLPGAVPDRYPTVIQIVPVPENER